MSKETNRIVEIYKELEKEAPDLPFTAIAMMAVGVFYKETPVSDTLSACEEALRQAEGELSVLKADFKADLEQREYLKDLDRENGR